MKQTDMATVLADALQWGRDQLIAEIFPTPEMPLPKTSLQWGRDQLIAEIP